MAGVTKLNMNIPMKTHFLRSQMTYIRMAEKTDQMINPGEAR